jgi:transposase, IS30 family
MSYTHLTSNERYVIAHLKAFKLSLREIARRIGRSASSVSRELKRNGPGDGWVYWYDAAQQRAEQRKRKARSQRRRSHEALYKLVVSSLCYGLSPQIIAERLKREYPRQHSMRISHEGIYQWVFADAKSGGDLYQSLVRHHKHRRKNRLGYRRRLFEGRVSITTRPLIVAHRRRFGDWESDTLEGARSSGGLATHVERKSRYLLAGKLDNKLSATFTATTLKLFAQVPKRRIKTMTVDNGSEFAKFKEIEQHTGVSIYFADPHSPWQRGCNENTNGLLRRYFPKGFDFRLASDKLIQVVVDKLNHRPRKCLNYRTAYEVFFNAKTVALRS